MNKKRGYAKSRTENKTESKNTVLFVFFATKFLLKLLTTPWHSFINIYSCSKFVSAQCTPVVHVRYAPEPNKQKEPGVNPIFLSRGL